MEYKYHTGRTVLPCGTITFMRNGCHQRHYYRTRYNYEFGAPSRTLVRGAGVWHGGLFYATLNQSLATPKKIATAAAISTTRHELVFLLHPELALGDEARFRPLSSPHLTLFQSFGSDSISSPVQAPVGISDTPVIFSALTVFCRSIVGVGWIFFSPSIISSSDFFFFGASRKVKNSSHHLSGCAELLPFCVACRCDTVSGK